MSGALPVSRILGRPSLVVRILLVNLVALLGFAVGILYVDSFRVRLLSTRQAELVGQGEVIAHMLADPMLPTGAALAAVSDLSFARGTRVRVFDPAGRLVVDNWRNPAVVRFTLEDPTTRGFRRWSAQTIDRFVDFASAAEPLPQWREPESALRAGWPDAEAAARDGRPRAKAAQGPERAVVLEAAVPVRAPVRPAIAGSVVLLTADTGDVVESVRQERERSFWLFLAVLATSLLLSAYLARTIVKPLGQLALAAQRVRRGRARDVEIPRFPERRDEIGRLARALSDMTASLRQRIDATEAFAADVAHELKNPLASLRSAVEALGTVRRPEDREKLFGLISDDVKRIDRLILDIAAASRLEAELSRTPPRPVDLAALVAQMAEALTRAASGSAGQPGPARLLVEPGTDGPAIVLADPGRLEQVIGNLVDNAMGFSPPQGTVRIGIAQLETAIELFVEDEGPGVPADLREAIFERFYSERPAGETYGTHSGLGLSIVRAIVEAFDGEARVTDRADGRPGARFVVRLPAAAATVAALPGA
jgi:two-component system sensor histidine kinase ChvG